jgi:hypothetical protein
VEGGEAETSTMHCFTCEDEGRSEGEGEGGGCPSMVPMVPSLFFGLCLFLVFRAFVDRTRRTRRRGEA